MKLIQLKQVLDNKRFLLFTIFIPVAWYVFLYNIQQEITPNIMLGIAVFIGIIGNSLATFSKRISSNIDFYSFESKFSKYTVKNYLLDQTLVQLVLNTLIFVVILAVGILFFSFPLNSQLVVQFFLLTIMGIYFSIIGFVIGVRLDEKIIDTVSFPVIILASMTIIPFASLGAEGGFKEFIGKVQMIFPGYYYTNIVNALTSSTSIDVKDVALFIGVFILNVIPLYFLVPKVKLATVK
ncbi:ABC transporter [uncultured Granulicatella sp.]|uniref:ABC transporter n=1 Tax=uncultured Granulicatella sp. TaxID=316089 RepID=UPI002584BE82|nr:ABC transporter [uncultured Granulicatella sp.]